MNRQETAVYLNQKQQQLTQRIAAINTDFKKGRSQDFSEQTSESENDEVLTEIQHEAEIELQQVTEAIHRLENNQYGICSSCNETINLKRLFALPYTNTCINCAQ